MSPALVKNICENILDWFSFKAALKTKIVMHITRNSKYVLRDDKVQQTRLLRVILRVIYDQECTQKLSCKVSFSKTIHPNNMIERAVIITKLF